MSQRNQTTRRSLIAAIFLAGAAWLVSGSFAPGALGQSEEGVVILLNARNPTQTISSAEASKIFLGQTAFWHGVVPVKLLVRPDGSISAKSFYDAVLSMTPQAFRKHWDELQLSGRGVAPKAIASPEELATAISQSPGAIGYALASEAWKLNAKGVKIVQVR